MAKSLTFQTHDHARCVSDNLSMVETACSDRGVRLTPIRRRVLEILLEEHRAIGAYDVLGRLAEDGLGSQPPVVYRALEFLVGQGFAHRVPGISAFIACGFPTEAHSPVFLICRSCKRVAEADPGTATDAIQETAAIHGFAVERASIEAEGLCDGCAAAE